MARKLKELAKVILLNNFTHEEWLEIDREVDEAIVCSAEEECQDFADSGAGEVLDMVCSGIRNTQKSKTTNR